MSLWTMEEETRNNLAIILSLHKGVLRESLCRMLWSVEQWEVPIIPEAPLKSQKSWYSVLVYSVQYWSPPRRNKLFSLAYPCTCKKNLKIFYSPAEIRKERSEVEISTNLSNLFSFLLAQKSGSVLYGELTGKLYIAELVFRMLKGIVEETLTKAWPFL